MSTYQCQNCAWKWKDSSFFAGVEADGCTKCKSNIIDRIERPKLDAPGLPSEHKTSSKLVHDIPQDNEAWMTTIEQCVEYAIKYGDNSLSVLHLKHIFQAEADTHPSTSRGYQMGYKAGRADLIAQVRQSLPEKIVKDTKFEPPLDGTIVEVYKVGTAARMFNVAIAKVTAALDTLERGA